MRRAGCADRVSSRIVKPIINERISIDLQIAPDRDACDSASGYREDFCHIGVDQTVL